MGHWPGSWPGALAVASTVSTGLYVPARISWPVGHVNVARCLSAPGVATERGVATHFPNAPVVTLLRCNSLCCLAVRDAQGASRQLAHCHTPLASPDHTSIDSDRDVPIQRAAGLIPAVWRRTIAHRARSGRPPVSKPASALSAGCLCILCIDRHFLSLIFPFMFS